MRLLDRCPSIRARRARPSRASVERRRLCGQEADECAVGRANRRRFRRSPRAAADGEIGPVVAGDGVHRVVHGDVDDGHGPYLGNGPLTRGPVAARAIWFHSITTSSATARIGVSSRPTSNAVVATSERELPTARVARRADVSDNEALGPPIGRPDNIVALRVADALHESPFNYRVCDTRLTIGAGDLAAEVQRAD